MKDDLTNTITGSVTADGGLPLVVKVRHEHPFIHSASINQDVATVNELRRLE